MNDNVSLLLETALGILNNGENWCKNDFHIGNSHCAWGSLSAAMVQLAAAGFYRDSQSLIAVRDIEEAISRLDEALPHSDLPSSRSAGSRVPCFNDDPKTTWEDINLLFKKAISE